MWFCDWLVAFIVQMGNFSQMNKRNWFPFTWLILWGIFHSHSCWCFLPLFVLLLWGYVWWAGLAGLWSIIFDEVDGFSHHSFAKLDIQFELRSFLIDFDWGNAEGMKVSVNLIMFSLRFASHFYFRNRLNLVAILLKSTEMNQVLS